MIGLGIVVSFGVCSSRGTSSISPSYIHMLWSVCDALGTTKRGEMYERDLPHDLDTDDRYGGRAQCFESGLRRCNILVD